MAIHAKTHKDLHVSTVRFEGTVTATEFMGLVDHYTAASGHAAKIDGVHVFERGVNLDQVDRDVLIDFKRRLVAGRATVQQPVYVRNALICREPSCLHVLEAWASMSAPDDGLFGQPRIMDNLDAACAWLGLSDAEARVVRDAFPPPPSDLPAQSRQ